MNDSLDDIESTSSSNYNNNSDSYYSLDEFLPSVCSKDTNARLDIYSRLEEYLKNEHTNLHCMDMNQFCNAILAWISSSNFKISINGLTIIQLLIQRLTEPLRNYSTEIVTVIVDRLADGKEQVRFASKNILIFMMASYTPNFIWEKLTIGFNHKLPKVREETLALLEDTLNKFGAQNLQLNKLVTSIVKLLGDANQFVRDKSFETIIEIYKHVGDRLRMDLKKKQLPEAKIKLIFNKFDEVIRNGELKEEAKQSNNKSSDLVDSTSTSNNTNTCASLPPTTAKQSNSSKMIPSSRSNMALLSSNRTGSAASSANQGGIDEETFMNAFETVPKIQIYSAKDLDQQMSQIIDCLSDTENDWVKRVDSLKRIRSLAIACANQYDDEFFACLKQLAVSFTLQIKDLRSQIVREACITIAYLSQCVGNRLEHFVELSMPHLINLIQNSAKIMALSGVVAIRFIIENTHSARLIPLIASSISSRSKEIRRYCCEFLNQLLQTWEIYHLEKHVQLIQTCIKKGLADADQEARVFSRKAFWSFSSHYPQAADNLLVSLDVKTQKLLQTGGQGGTFGSVKSLKDGYSSNNYSGNYSASNYNDSVDNGSRYGTVKQSAIHSNAQNTPASKIKRSTSAVDIKNPRTNSALSSRIPVPGDSATSTRSTTSRIPTCINPTPKSHLGSARIAHSQPGSRSTSPTPKYSYITHNNHGGFLTSPMTINNATNYNLNSSFNNNNSTINNNNDLALTPNGGSAKVNGVYGSANRSLTSSATKSKIPTSSRNSSRESSPGRRSNYGSSYGKVPGRRLFSRQLTNNSDSEQAIANAMTSKYRMKRWDDSDEASETSSICSERSFSSSIGGTRITEDMNEAITCLSSSQWSDRRDGLVNLKNMMTAGRIFSRQEIKRLCEIFSKLFHDQHVKVFTLFLDALTDFIRSYKRDLKEWLYVLLTRLLTKIGSESSPSIYHKLCSCLEITRSSFDLDLQFKILIQFIKENTTQTSNLKVKVAVLKFLQDHMSNGSG
jgi:CLIP-associating protein 1/2